MIKVAILLDETNDWLRAYFPTSFFQRAGRKVDLFYDHCQIKSYQIIFVLGYTRILDKHFLKNNKLVLLVHESDLPRGKGFSPVQWQILEGRNRITVSLIEMIEEIDGGDIVDQMDLVLNGTEIYDEIREAQATTTLRLLEKFLRNYPNFNKRKQIGISSFYRRRTPEDSELDINSTLRDLFPLLRIANNQEWPSFFKILGETYFLEVYKKEKSINRPIEGKRLCFEEVKGSSKQIKLLFELLKERQFNISHKQMPSFKDHEKFVKNNRYRSWQIVFENRKALGSFYLKNDNSIGLNLNDNSVTNTQQILSYIKSTFIPNEAVASEIPSYFYFNVSSKNKALQRSLADIGLDVIQYSYRI